MSVAIMRNAPVQKKTVRNPMASASAPPISGPIRLPAIAPVCSVPRALPECSFGVIEACSDMDMETNPEKMPLINRNNSNCHAVPTRPMRAVTIPMPKQARINMILRPRLSANAPQIG